jgi:hypothetical protein
MARKSLKEKEKEEEAYPMTNSRENKWNFKSNRQIISIYI